VSKIVGVDGIVFIPLFLKSDCMRKRLFVATLLGLIFISCTKNDNGNGFTVAKESYALPGDTLFPEGIVYNDKTGNFYTGSVSSGNILEVNVESGDTRLLASGAAHNRKAATGMKIDQVNRLWVCGGADNKIQVLGLDGSLIKSWDTNALFGSGFINDCIIDNTHVYFTDSRVRKIYRTSVTETTPGNLEEWLTFTDAQIPYATTGTNANGIVSTPDNKYLIIVVSSSGKLYRIDKATKAITEITLNTPVTSGDGLYIEGNTLYVSRNATNLIFPVTPNADYSQGTVGTGFGTNLMFNTTMAKAGNYFLVVNGQLNRRGNATTPASPTLPFSVSRVAIP
jgi:Cu-Zn family superoxide dismutase